MEYFAKGYVASCAGILASYPIDTVKSHIQNARGSLTVQHAAFQLGLVGMYRGVVPQLLFMSSAKSLRFVFYEGIRERFDVSIFVAGVCSGGLVSLFTNPLEVHKTRRQMALPFKWKSDLYRGWVACMMRESIMAASMFYINDRLSTTIESKGLLALASSLPGCLLSVPVDVFKTRMQTSPIHQRLRDVILESLKREGVKVLFKGGVLRVLKALPQTSITMYIYSLLV